MMTPVRFVRCATTLLLGAAALAQVPDGYVVWGSFQGAAGQNGVYFSHPRDTTAAPIEVTNLPASLSYDPLQNNRGAASLLRRPSDERLIVGERAPAGTNVDVHVLTLLGADVVASQAFTVGVSVNEGEVPQMGLLPDGRVVLAATDLAPGAPLAQFLTASFNYEGVGILDTTTGAITPIVIPNLNQFPGVINGLTVTPDGQTVYITNWISTMSGDLWEVPITGGNATQVASLPAPGSNLAVDVDGSVLVATLNGPPNIFRYDPRTQTTTNVSSAMGPLNAIAIESVTGSCVVATANGGLPPRTLFRKDASGQEHLLVNPGRATISSVDVNHNPERYGHGTPGALSYDWQLTPNAGGLPESGNMAFGLTLAASRSTTASLLFVMSLAPSAPVAMWGMDVLIDLTVVAPVLSTLNDTATLPFPLPPGPALVGIGVYTQAFVLEPAGALAASPGVSFTIL